MNENPYGRGPQPFPWGGCPGYGSSKESSEYIYVSGYGFAPPPPVVNERRLLRSYSSHLGLAILAFLLLSNLLYGILYGVLRGLSRIFSLLPFPMVSSLTLSEAASGLSYLLALSIPFLVYAWHIHLPLDRALPLRRPNWRIALPAVPIALSTTVVGMFCSMAISVVVSLFGFLPVAPDLSAPHAVSTGIIYFINSAIFPAFLEEMVFRGIMMQSLRRFGDSFALLTSAILFGAVHGNLVQAPNAFLAGLVIGYFVLRTGSLWTGILIHFVNNSLAIFVSVAASAAEPALQSGIVYSVYLLYLLAGVVAFLFLLREQTGLFTFRPANTVSTEREKYACFFTSAGILSALILLGILSTRYLIAL